MSTESNEIAKTNVLDTLTDMGAILEYFASQNVALDDDATDGIKSLPIVDNKDTLIDVPFLLVQWRFNEGDFGTFVSAEIALKDGGMFVLNDGSTGIAAQLASLTAHREEIGHPMPFAGRMVRGGLRRSDYEYTDEKGNEIPAHTYYLVF